MRTYLLGEQLQEVSRDVWEETMLPAVFITDSKNSSALLEKTGIVQDSEIEISKIEFNKIENQQGCIAGTLCIPKLLDVLGSKYKMAFFVTRNYIVFVDDGNFSWHLIQRIQRKKAHQGETIERFLYNFIAEFLSRDTETLITYEKTLFQMEEGVIKEKNGNLEGALMPLRRKLLIFRSYYDEIMDMSKAFEENENGIFVKKHLKYFGILGDRADRLLNRTEHLLTYAQQIKDAYQAQIDAKQNKNMQFLTVISTLFFPLTLITSWFGMNFKDMPGLENGYPMVVGLSIIIILACLILFKKKHIL